MSPRRAIITVSMLAVLCRSTPVGGQRFQVRPSQPIAPSVAGASRTVAPGATDGQRAFLGIVGDDSRGPGSGASVLSVQGGGPADVAGILPGDVITAVAGIPVRNLDQLARKIQEVGPGQRVMVRIQRRGRPMDVTVLLAGRGPATSVDSSRDPADPASSQQLEELPLPIPTPDAPPSTHADPAAVSHSRPSATSKPAAAPLPAPPPATPSPIAPDPTIAGKTAIPDRARWPSDDAAGTRGGPPQSTGDGEVDEMRRRIDSMQREIALLKQQLAEMKARLDAVENSR